MPEEILIPIRAFFSKYWAMMIFILGCVIAAYISIIFFGLDNEIEQKAEEFIEKETGVKIDLTP
jgi:hypothetical protein